MTPNQVMVAVGREKKVLSLRGKPHKVVQRFAQQHAKYMAERLTSGHQNWARRREQLIVAAPDATDFVEVCVASWDWNTKPRPAAVDIFDSWKASPGHWSVVNGRFDYWSYAMVQGSDGRWFGCGIMANKK